MAETFKRYEFKYLISMEQKQAVLEVIKDFMSIDKYGRNLICNIYYDTPSKYLIRESLEHPHYKEKIRVRSYGVADENSKVYIELKKKYDSVVYKRRVSAGRQEAQDFFSEKIPLQKNGQVAKELEYARSFYKELAPSVYLSYEREAYYSDKYEELRVTFDENIIWRDYDLNLTVPPSGERIIPEDMSLMEIKIPGTMPLELARVLSENKINKTSFSKYGKAYLEILGRDKEK